MLRLALCGWSLARTLRVTNTRNGRDTDRSKQYQRDLSQAAAPKLDGDCDAFAPKMVTPSFRGALLVGSMCPQTDTKMNFGGYGVYQDLAGMRAKLS